MKKFLRIEKVSQDCRVGQVIFSGVAYEIFCSIAMVGLNKAKAVFVVSLMEKDDTFATVAYTSTKEVSGLSPDIIDFWVLKELETNGAVMVAVYNQRLPKKPNDLQAYMESIIKAENGADNDLSKYPNVLVY